MKFYYEYFDWYTALLMPIYFIVSLSTILFIANKVLIKDKMNVLFYICLMFFYCLILIADIIIDWIPFFTDSHLYINVILNTMSSSQISQSLDFNKGVGFRILSYPFCMVALFKPLPYFVILIAINQIAFLLVWKAWLLYKKKHVTISAQRCFLFLVLFYPIGIIYSMVPLREPYFFMGFGLFLVGTYKKQKINIEIVLGLLILLLLRRQYMVLVPILLAISFILDSTGKISKKRVCVSILFVSLSYNVMNQIALKILHIGITPIKIVAMRNYHAKSMTGQGVYPMVDWENWFDIIIYIPKLTLQFLIAPFPIVAPYNIFGSIGYLVDAIYMIIILITLGIGNKVLPKNMHWVLFVVAFIIATSFYEFYITGAVRHRYVPTAMLLPIVAEILGNRKRKIRIFNFSV